MHPSVEVSLPQCSEQDQKHQCSIAIYGTLSFKSNLHQKKSSAEEEAAKLAWEWLQKPGKTRLKEYCDRRKLNVEYKTNPAPDGFQISVIVEGLKPGHVGDVKKTKTEAEHSAAENALIELQRKYRSVGNS